MNSKLNFLNALAFFAISFAFIGCQEDTPKTAQTTKDEPEVKVSVTGGTLKKLTGDESGLSLAIFPQVKSISFKSWKAMADIPKTGVFLVGSDHLPLNFTAELKAEGLILQNDGSLVDSEGNLTTLFVHTESFQVTQEGQEIKENLRVNGNPFAFLNYTYDMYWKYNGGYCRDYQAWTKAYAWGPKVNGEFLPTKIEYIYTRASIGSRNDTDYCYNCQTIGSYSKWDIGCFWPAHGKAGGTHYAFWKDGTIQLNASWSWDH